MVTYDAAADNTAFKRKQEKLEDSPKPKKSKKEKVKEEPSEESVKTEPDTEDTPKKEKKVLTILKCPCLTKYFRIRKRRRRRIRSRKKQKKSKSAKLHVPLPKILKTSPRLILPDFRIGLISVIYLFNPLDNFKSFILSSETIKQIADKFFYASFLRILILAHHGVSYEQA